MFITLLIVTFAFSFLVSFLIILVFDNPIKNILKRIIQDDISYAWNKYLKFALYVIGISSGVRIWNLEKYITPVLHNNKNIINLTTERWVLEIYRTIISTLQGEAWLLLIFFIFALIAYVIVRIIEQMKSLNCGKN